MPGLDQTGPLGKGSMTGRRAGRCTNFGAGARKKTDAVIHPEEERLQGANPGRGRGPGSGRGRGRGRGQGLQNRVRGNA